MEVVDDHDRPETPVRERPRAAVFEVPGKSVRQAGNIPVNGEHGMASGCEEPGMAAPACGQVEYGRGGRYEVGEARDPSGYWHRTDYDIICGA